GIQPQLNECVSCGETNPPKVFSIREAGYLCKNCAHQDPHAYALTEQTARLLRLFYYFELDRLGTISLKKETRQQLKNIILAYYDEYSGLMLKSRRFLEQMDRMGDHLS